MSAVVNETEYNWPHLNLHNGKLEAGGLSWLRTAETVMQREEKQNSLMLKKFA